MQAALLILGGCLSGLILDKQMVVGQSDPDVTETVTIDVESTGEIKGFLQEALGITINTFLGVPFAEPPIDNLRFKKPRPVTRRQETIQATVQPATCVQDTALLVAITGGDSWLPRTELSEDCLYLNIWAPAEKPVASGYGVMVWIHGGGYAFGGASLPVYDGKFMVAASNVVVVAIQYRLGLFGFLYSGTNDSPGNMGLLDQHLALKWVYDNIGAFGGDNSKIAIFGESAGGHSVLMHTLSPLPKYFNVGIIQSSPYFDSVYKSPEQARQKFLMIADSFGCSRPSEEAIVDCISEANLERLQNYISTDPDAVFVTVDGEFFTSAPTTRFDDVTTPLIVGSNKDEGYFVMSLYLESFTQPFEPPVLSKEEVKNVMPFIIRSTDGKVIDYVIDLYSEVLFGDAEVSDYLPVATSFAGDYYFTCPARRFASEVADAGNDVFLYEMEHRSSLFVPPYWHGATHGVEIDHVFGFPLNQTIPYHQEERLLSAQMIDLWTTFAKTGNPNTYRAIPIEWPSYNTLDRQHLVLDAPRNRRGSNLKKKECDFWNKVFPEFLDGGQLDDLLRRHGLTDSVAGAEMLRCNILLNFVPLLFLVMTSAIRLL